MKNLVCIFVLLMIYSLNAVAQKDKIIFRTTTIKTYQQGVDKPKKMSATEYPALLVFKSNEVRFNDGTSWKDVVFPIQHIVKKGNRLWAYECEDRTFTLDIQNLQVVVTYKSDYVTIYYGMLYYGTMPDDVQMRKAPQPTPKPEPTPIESPQPNESYFVKPSAVDDAYCVVQSVPDHV